MPSAIRIAKPTAKIAVTPPTNAQSRLHQNVRICHVKWLS
jgi:hypothetical protein